MDIFNNTADGIMSTFTKTVTKLEVLADKKVIEIESITKQLNELQLRQNEASKEALKSRKFANNIKALMAEG